MQYTLVFHVKRADCVIGKRFDIVTTHRVRTIVAKSSHS